MAHHNAAGSRVRSYIMENIVGNHFHIFCLLKDDIVCFNVFISEKCFPLQRSKKLDADESAKCQKAGQTTDGQTVLTVKMQRTFKCNFVIGHLCLIESLQQAYSQYFKIMIKILHSYYI